MAEAPAWVNNAILVHFVYSLLQNSGKIDSGTGIKCELIPHESSVATVKISGKVDSILPAKIAAATQITPEFATKQKADPMRLFVGALKWVTGKEVVKDGVIDAEFSANPITWPTSPN